MIPLVEYPELVTHYAPHFKELLSEEAYEHIQKYISGLVISENKTVEGINRLFVHESRNQSSLNRVLKTKSYPEAALNEKRLELLNSLEGTRIKEKGVLSLDDTHLTHYGKEFEDIAYLYDSSTKTFAWSHNLVTLHYSDDKTDYPLHYELWKPADLDKIEQGLSQLGIKLRESKFALKSQDEKKWRQYLLGVWSRNQSKAGVEALYESKLAIARRQLDKWVAAHPDLKLPVAFDSWFTQPAFCRYLTDTLEMPYVGTLKKDNKVVIKGKKEELGSFAQRLKEEHLEAVKAGGKALFHKITIKYKGEKEVYYSYCRTHRIHNFGKQRLVINFRKADLSDSPVFYNSNRLNWQSVGITRIRRHRWPVEVYHEEGKAEGLDQYQVRDITAIYRHIGLVVLTYSLLRAAPHDQALIHMLQRQIKFVLVPSAAHWRRLSQAQSLWSLALFIATQIELGHSLADTMEPLLAAVCY